MSLGIIRVYLFQMNRNVLHLVQVLWIVCGLEELVKLREVETLRVAFIVRDWGSYAQA